MRNRSLERQREEIAKCILVCANCHRLIHAISSKK
jgi:predicted HNH restriction endonuclease